MSICIETQGFYDYKNNLYASLIPPMKGHGGIDINCGYGTPIECPLDGYVYSVFDDKRPAADGYWAIFMICEYKGQIGELCIGHVSKLFVDIGQTIKKGDVIALEGNHGVVYDGTTLITLAMQKAGDQRGHHRHWQWRPLKKSKTPIGECLSDFTGRIYTDKEGMVYQIPNWLNGYHGLSPIISDIISEYDAWKLNQAIISNVEPSPVLTPTQQNLIGRITDQIKLLISNLKKYYGIN